jgi:outer membrane lipoprotein SlyB
MPMRSRSPSPTPGVRRVAPSTSTRLPFGSFRSPGRGGGGVQEQTLSTFDTGARTGTGTGPRLSLLDSPKPGLGSQGQGTRIQPQGPAESLQWSQGRQGQRMLPSSGAGRFQPRGSQPRGARGRRHVPVGRYDERGGLMLVPVDAEPLDGVLMDSGAQRAAEALAAAIERVGIEVTQMQVWPSTQVAARGVTFVPAWQGALATVRSLAIGIAHKYGLHAVLFDGEDMTYTVHYTADPTTVRQEATERHNARTTTIAGEGGTSSTVGSSVFGAGLGAIVGYLITSGLPWAIGGAFLGAMAGAFVGSASVLRGEQLTTTQDVQASPLTVVNDAIEDAGTPPRRVIVTRLTPDQP